jgi:hypothetical protein
VELQEKAWKEIIDVLGEQAPEVDLAFGGI